MTPQEDWARLRHHVEAALATGRALESLDDVERLVASGHYQAWFGRESIAITEICQYPARKVLMVRHGGGDLTELMDELEPAMCEFALFHGCDAIGGEGRRGWERAMEKRGYRFAFITLIKDLVN